MSKTRQHRPMRPSSVRWIFLLLLRRDAAVAAAAADCTDESPECTTWAQQGECSTNPGYMMTACRAACGKCTPSAKRQAGGAQGAKPSATSSSSSSSTPAPKPADVLQEYTLHVGVVHSSGKALSQAHFTLSDARKRCDGLRGCAAFSMQVPEPHPLPTGVLPVKFFSTAPSVDADVGWVTYRREKTGGQSAGGGPPSGPPAEGTDGADKRRASMLASYYVASAELLAAGKKHQAVIEQVHTETNVKRAFDFLQKNAGDKGASAGLLIADKEYRYGARKRISLSLSIYMYIYIYIIGLTSRGAGGMIV